MPKGPNQKRKLLYLLDILARETDEEHPLTLEQLRQLLAAEADRAAERGKRLANLLEKALTPENNLLKW